MRCNRESHYILPKFNCNFSEILWQNRETMFTHRKGGRPQGTNTMRDFEARHQRQSASRFCELCLPRLWLFGKTARVIVRDTNVFVSARTG